MPNAAVDELSWLSDLRPDERERAAAHFRVLELARGERVSWKGAESARMGMLLSGSAVLERAELTGLPPVRLGLRPGDRWGETALFASVHSPVDVEAVSAARIAVLDEPGLRALAREFPVVWMGIATALSVELKWKNDVLREIQEFDAQRVSEKELELFLESPRRKLARHRTGVARRAGQVVLRALFTDPGREPAFWILTGFVSAIAISRAVVAAILHFHLEHALFNLHETGAGNPTHTHHFTYGFALTIAAGLAAFFPRTRRFLKTLAAVFGFGLGLVFDEFALIWNLNPDYYQRLSYEAQAALLLLLVQIVWFRRFYARWLARLFVEKRP